MNRILAFCFLIIPSFLFAQFPPAETSAHLYKDLLKANNTARVLYLAAHPDDENTRLISYFENGRHVRTAYLSLNRGAGGQNLIGTEIGPAIGVLRTHELLKARAIDGGEQFFTRAVDFGYSKTADETFDKWGKETILGDVVRTIRLFRPHVIITRFPTESYGGHGHHIASAILAEEAFDLAADPNAFPEQLDALEPWQTTRLYYNASTWWNPKIAELAETSDDYVSMDVGGYEHLLGESYSQIAARSRSSHASQGFGADYPYGKAMEYLRYEKGDKVPKGEDILVGIDQGWEKTSVPQVGEILEKAIADFDFRNPEKTVPAVIEVLKLLRSAEPDPLISYKTEEFERLLLKLAAVEVHYYANKPKTIPSDTLATRLMVSAPTAVEVKVLEVNGKSLGADGVVVGDNPYSADLVEIIDENSPYDNPYWLSEIGGYLYKIDDPSLLDRPVNRPSIAAEVKLSVGGYEVHHRSAAQYKTVDPTRGVVYTPVYIVPPITYNFSEAVVISPAGSDQTAELIATAHADNVSGSIELQVPRGWKAEPSAFRFDFEDRGSKEVVRIHISRSNGAESGQMRLKAENGEAPLSLTEITHSHIPAQILLQPAEIALSAIDLNRGEVRKIGYIEGPGDDVAKYLRTAGYDVHIVSEAEFTAGISPEDYDAIVTGIRAFNTRDELVLANDKLNEYVKGGGTWIVQYLTTAGLKTDRVGPYPFTVSRERVTDENSDVRFLAPNHPALRSPNILTPKDFEGWVQERGLYFAVDWDPAFTAVLGWNDPGEPSRDGGLIVAPYGKGHFVYTGISFFRELPAGVPGAYRLMANILTLSKTASEHHD